ncbi:MULTISPECIES: thioredoxin family protein [unclassified Pseudoclavibacter]|uniref:thioredoxin family protein n=1 Tax=unclassified Pseudoclavibacter TaxID=2615177 RepID=UPI001BAE55CC|nr:thioredoxin family protein [Pseudoclavibacter sp. Marseille-Q4354]MBS3178241.1 thioredoxin family protein [Pseudoclavibacter sp. Marseille-Q4354]
MDATTAALLVGALVVIATVVGVAMQRTSGRLKRAAQQLDGAPDLDLLADGPPQGKRATLILFSTAFCARCPATKRMLEDLAAQTPGVVVAEVDLTDRQDLARSYDVRQTPTVLVLDDAGTRVARIGGPPRRAELQAQLQQLSA